MKLPDLRPSHETIAALLTALLILAVILLTTAATTTAPKPQVGRYQLHITPTGGHPLIIDTTTGHTWLGRPDRTNTAQIWYPFPPPTRYHK